MPAELQTREMGALEKARSLRKRLRAQGASLMFDEDWPREVAVMGTSFIAESSRAVP